MSDHPHRPHRPRRRRLLERVLVAGAVATVGSAAVVIDATAADAPSAEQVTVRTVAASPATPIEADQDVMVSVVALTGPLEELASLEAVEPPPPAPPAPESAAPRGVWDDLAQCEATGDWSINTGNGYYGGLQFDLSSWRWAGGDRYAAYPHQATRAQQIATAERLLEIHPAGWGAWPACSRALGLR